MHGRRRLIFLFDVGFGVGGDGGSGLGGDVALGLGLGILFDGAAGIIVIVIIAAVVVIAFVLRHVDVVEHHADEVAADFFNHLLGADGHGLRIAAVLDDLHDEIHFAGQNGGVADAEDGRRVEEDEIIALLEFGDHLLHLGGAEDAHGTVGQPAAGHEIETRHGGGLD